MYLPMALVQNLNSLRNSLAVILTSSVLAKSECRSTRWLRHSHIANVVKFWYSTVRLIII